AVTEPFRRLDERRDRLVIGDRGIPIVDVPARRRLETDRSGGDGQVTQTHPRLEGSARADPYEGRTLRDRQDLSHDDLDIVRADAGRDDRHPLTLVYAGGRCELPVSVLELDRIEARGDPWRPVLVPGEEDVLGQFARSESDVVLPFTFWDRDPAVSRRLDAGVRVRQDPSSLT